MTRCPELSSPGEAHRELKRSGFDPGNLPQTYWWQNVR